ncbi:MAG: carbohydate-binding domain-containing protein [Bacteroides sp.]|nr:carbohydate-binding domain-containing protein [Bacteroides sp.]
MARIRYTFRIALVTLVGCLSLLAGCTSAGKSAPVCLTWELSNRDVGKGYFENSFTLKNLSDAPLDKGWTIYFSQHPRRIYQEEDAPIRVEVVNATHCKLYPTEYYTPLAAGDSLVVTFRCKGEVPNRSMVPEAPYWVSEVDGQESVPLAISFQRKPLPATLQQTEAARLVYEANERILSAMNPVCQSPAVIPAVKQFTATEGRLRLEGGVALNIPDEFATEGRLLQEKLAFYGLQAEVSAPASITLESLPEATPVVNEEYYELTVAETGVRIAAATAHGIFNGTQTLLALLKGQQTPYLLQCGSIKDYPELLYRGHMLDIARNYTSVEQVKKLIDLMASYKLNVFHFHFCDDEGWRLEIPGLEELTDVASRRGHTTDESQCLYPAYDGHYDSQAATTGNGYYTRSEFIDLLRYAAERHVCVIPEIESPGHARAAIVAMKARYNKYIDSDPAKAHEYLLSDSQDTSQYLSAQWYRDNVMNVALPSTYRFMEKVIQELKSMYQEAGVPLTSIQIGGDEVAKGAWIGSPVCQAFMKEQGMTQPRQLSEYFIKKVVGYLQEQGIPFGGWQEVAMDRSEETDTYLSQRSAGIYCWKTTAKNNMDEIVYQMANKGYPVILCNVTNFYFDLAYDVHPDEPGHYWGGYVDEAKSFSVLPYQVYRSIRNNLVGNTDSAIGKTMLTEQGRKQIKGLQSTLFAETIRGPQWVEYYMFPKLMGLSERAWLASPAWETLSGADEQQAFEQDLAFYYQRIARCEMPDWKLRNVNFRLPYSGLCIREGKLYANTPIVGAEIRYTTDGTEPTPTSLLWQEPIECTSTVKAKLFYLDKESVTVTIE